MKAAFSRFLGADRNRLHAAAHSHHPWPDVTFDAHVRAWEDAARLMDDKWDHVFGTVFASARSRVARVLGLDDPNSLVFAPNTHELVVRIASTLPTPFRVLTTDAEFHSFTRQVQRWEEAGTAVVDRVAAEPCNSFPDRLVEAFDDQHLVFFSHVLFNSGYVVPDLAEISGHCRGSTVVVDGYHGFMALPTDLSPLAEHVLYLAGGYKYAMAGEGACFLHVPPTAPLRPPNTGWWAGFGSLTDEQSGVPYASDGRRFAGATADPSGVYRLDAVLGWLEGEGIDVAAIHSHVVRLQAALIDQLPSALTETLIPGRSAAERGHFLTFRRADAAELCAELRSRGVITDHRADRWRIGLGVYHDETDIDRLSDEIATVTTLGRSDGG